MSSDNGNVSGKERTKLIVLAGLVLVMLVAVYWAFFSSGKKAAPAKSKAATSTSQAKNGAPPKKHGEGAEVDPFGPVIPLDLGLVAAGTPGTVTITRNLFTYPPPPIPTPPKLPPPPIQKPATINLAGLSPSSAVAGSGKSIDVNLTGSLFPIDAQAFWNGRPVDTQRLSSTQLRVRVTPADIAAAGSVPVRVNSKSQPALLWSRELAFQVERSPDPGDTMTYLGRIGDRAVIQMKTSPNQRQQLVGIGQTVGTSIQWRILAIKGDQLELLDVRNDIRKTLSLAKKS